MVNNEVQIGDDLIIMVDMETLVNEGIFLEDTGINLRDQNEQDLLNQISELE